MEVRCIPSLLQHLAVRLPHHVSWVHNGCSEDPRAGNGGRHERARPKSEAAWCNVIASRCKAVNYCDRHRHIPFRAGSRAAHILATAVPRREKQLDQRASEKSSSRKLRNSLFLRNTL